MTAILIGSLILAVAVSGVAVGIRVGRSIGFIQGRRAGRVEARRFRDVFHQIEEMTRGY